VTPTPVTPTPTAKHTDTQLRGAVENGKTTIFLKVCGQGSLYRFRSEQLAPVKKVLWDKTYNSLNGCSSDYRAVINAIPGEKFRFYSLVMSNSMSDTNFTRSARTDSCTVTSNGVIKCQQGNTPPPGTPIPPTPKSGFKLPFPGGTTRKCTQGNNGKFSHTGFSAYAFDWGIGVGGSVVAARDGRVTHIRQNSSRSGCSPAYRNDANFIVIRHSDNTESVYVHLKRNSARVAVGDYVRSGQVIAEVGNSGYVCGAHLHYYVRRAGSNKWSVPTTFLDVKTNNGVPTGGNWYTSGNYLSIIANQALRSVTPTDTYPPEGSVSFRMTGTSEHLLLLEAYDYESDDLQMRIASNLDDLETASWQAFATEQTWNDARAYVQYKDEDDLVSDVYFDILDTTTDQPVQANFTADSVVCTNQAVTIDNVTAQSCPQCGWEWSLGDGTTSREVVPISSSIGYQDIMYPDPGDYTITLTATNALSVNSTSAQVTVLPAPSPNFSLSRSGNTITVEATEENAEQWNWDFGDGTTATGRSTTHTYSDDMLALSPVVQLTITTTNRCTAESHRYLSDIGENNVFLPLMTK
jgi:murein DD-endopeptidase MepM/ murein hydrolase activator NlpD